MSDRHRCARLAIPPALDRTPQLLPVPLGGLTPVRRHPSTLFRLWRHHHTMAMTVTALLAGSVGVWLATTPVASSVVMTAAGVQVDGVALTLATSRTGSSLHIYTGPASLAIRTSSGRNSSAGAVMTWGGLATTGRCLLVATGAGASDACEFRVGSARLSSTDTFDARTHLWHRSYSDGVAVTIAVPAGSTLIPIPFPLGH